MTEESLKINLISHSIIGLCIPWTCFVLIRCSSVWLSRFIFKLYAAFLDILASFGLARLLRDWLDTFADFQSRVRRFVLDAR